MCSSWGSTTMHFSAKLLTKTNSWAKDVLSSFSRFLATSERLGSTESSAIWHPFYLFFFFLTGDGFIFPTQKDAFFKKSVKEPEAVDFHLNEFRNLESGALYIKRQEIKKKNIKNHHTNFKTKHLE